MVFMDKIFFAKYTRTTFWAISLTIVFIGSFVWVVLKNIGCEGFRLFVVIFINSLLILTLANRIRDYGSNPWLALWAILPFVGMFQAVYFGIRLKVPDNSTENSNALSPEKSVYQSEFKRYNYEHEDKEKNSNQFKQNKSVSLKRLN